MTLIDLDRYKKVVIGVDCVVLTTDTYKEDNPHKNDRRKLQVLLIKRGTDPYEGEWSLPGGLVEPDETIENTLDIKLLNKINLKDFYREQLYTYSDIDRDPRGRVISAAYIGMINKDNALGISNMGRGEPRWFWVSLDDNEVKIIDSITGTEITELAFDHKRILKDALVRLRNKVKYTDLMYKMLPEKFTMMELQDVFEEILGKTKYSFRRFIGNKVVDTGEYAELRAHRPARLYKYNG